MCFHTVQVEQLLTSCRCEANVHYIYKRKKQEERGLLSDQSSLVEERHTEVVYVLQMQLQYLLHDSTLRAQLAAR